jgi:hypothetical protein
MKGGLRKRLVEEENSGQKELVSRKKVGGWRRGVGRRKGVWKENKAKNEVVGRKEESVGEGKVNG